MPRKTLVGTPDPEDGDPKPSDLNVYGDSGFSSEKARQIYEQSKNWPAEQKKAALLYMQSAAKREEIKARYKNVAEIAASVDPSFVITPAWQRLPMPSKPCLPSPSTT